MSGSEALKTEASHRQIAEADFADDRENCAVIDLENVLRGKARLRDLTHAGGEQPHTDRPEDKPLADKWHQLAKAVAPRSFENYRGGRKEQKQQRQTRDTSCPLNGSRRCEETGRHSDRS